jgi:hypothetical protein
MTVATCPGHTIGEFLLHRPAPKVRPSKKPFLGEGPLEPPNATSTESNDNRSGGGTRLPNPDGIFQLLKIGPLEFL